MKCMKCKKREATKTFVSGGIMGLVHGMYEQWCEICVVETQLKFAREQAELIPFLSVKLAELYNDDKLH